MWSKLAGFILKFRVALLIIIAGITVFMAYQARQVKIAYNYIQLLPSTDSAWIDYQKFQQKFGADGAVMIAGMQIDSLFSNPEEFNSWYDLNFSVKNTSGIKDVISVASLFNAVKNDTQPPFGGEGGKIELLPLLKRKPSNKSELDSVKRAINALPFYQNFVLNRQTGSTLMLITFKEKELNTAGRIAIVDSVRAKMDAFGLKYHKVIHYSGMPYIRTAISRKILDEMKMFVLLAILVTTIILFLFFRSLYPVIFPLIIVIAGVIWSMSLINLLGYQITVLTGIIPPLIMVIGVPNCILLLNKYHTEYRKNKDKALALNIMVSKIGISIFLANITTAIGFAVFCSTHSQVLVEFGLVSSLGVMCTYLISLFLIPIFFSFLPPPAESQHFISLQNTKHLDSKRTVSILSGVNDVVLKRRKTTYLIVLICIIISIYGISKIKAVGYVVDDLPQNDPIYADMHYFEKNFGGVLPLEIEIDTRKRKGVFADNGKVLYKMERLQKMLSTYPYFSHPLSAPQFVKFANQAYHDGNSKYFIMPSVSDLSSISQYLSEAGKKQDMLKPFLDSTRQYTCVNLFMQDLGSVRMKEVLDSIKPRADSIFNYIPNSEAGEKGTWLPQDQRYKITFTGSCLIFLKGSDYLIKNLIESILLAIILVSIVLYLLFMSARMVIISTIPTIIPLLITLGLMGFFGVHLKPTTILTFSIAFGISSDGTMYFLTKYKQEMKRLKLSTSDIVSLVIKETGVSMIYTSIILSSGFMIFVFSGFGGTRALGLLVSVTLLMAYSSNLVVLPSFMVSLEKRLLQKGKIASVIDVEMEGIEDEDSPKDSSKETGKSN